MSNPTFNSPLHQSTKEPVTYTPTTIYYPTNASTNSKHSQTFLVVLSIFLRILLVLLVLLCLWIYKVLHPPASTNANFGRPAMLEVLDIVLSDPDITRKRVNCNKNFRCNIYIYIYNHRFHTHTWVLIVYKEDPTFTLSHPLAFHLKLTMQAI